jgi:tRNA pseudouridine55 synthase
VILEGVLLIDKPKGISSFDVIRRLRKISGVKKIGHAGTLDPLASGLLVMCLGRYTKLSGYLMSHGSKIYETLIELGVSTSTDDAEGEVLARFPTTHLNEEIITQALKKFLGTFVQFPPKYSAVKVEGQRAYERARKSEDFELAGRAQTIYKLDILEIEGPFVRLRVECSKGTYIRSLARDLGKELGVGAYAKEIRRLKSGDFCIKMAGPLDSLNEENLSAHLLVGRVALSSLATVELSPENLTHALHGRILPLALNEQIAIAMFDNNPIAILAQEGDYARVLRGI